eukprot:scaffold111092_cov18-Tisochrysis_lutea.AAC.1
MSPEPHACGHHSVKEVLVCLLQVAVNEAYKARFDGSPTSICSASALAAGVVRCFTMAASIVRCFAMADAHAKLPSIFSCAVIAAALVQLFTMACKLANLAPAV